MAAAFPIIPVLHYLGRPELERPSFFAAATLAVAVEVCRELRTQQWFWVAIGLIAACHVPLVMLLPWRAGWIPALVSFLFCFVDLAAILAIIDLIEKLKVRTTDLLQKHDDDR
jgi:NAD/NADP transhydrogenase beta subunit